METPTPQPEEAENDTPPDVSFDRALNRLVLYLAIGAVFCAIVFLALIVDDWKGTEILSMVFGATLFAGISLGLLVGLPVVMYLWWKRGKKALVLTVLLFWIVAFLLTGGFCSGMYLKEIYRALSN